MTKRRRTGQLAKHKREIEDSATNGKEELMEAMVAACAAIAFADGNLDIRERRRMFTLIQTHPSFVGFSHADVAVEFERNKTAFEEDPETARREAFLVIRSLKASAAEAHFILAACRQVLEADGVRHPEEFSTLAEIHAALPPPRDEASLGRAH